MIYYKQLRGFKPTCCFGASEKLTLQLIKEFVLKYAEKQDIPLALEDDKIEFDQAVQLIGAITNGEV